MATFSLFIIILLLWSVISVIPSTSGEDTTSMLPSTSSTPSSSSSSSSSSSGQGKRVLNFMGLIPMRMRMLSRKPMCLSAIEMAVDDINGRSDILADYLLNMTWKDTECDAGIATKVMFEMLYTPPVKLMIIGDGCSPASQATAQVSHLWNITQISFGSGSPALSNRQRFPRFFRIGAGDLMMNQPRLKMMQLFGWKKIATIHESFEIFSDTTYALLELIRSHNITLITAEIFKGDTSLQVENLKRHDARIIVGGFYENTGRKIFCKAYRLGITGRKVVWFVPGWFGHEWWRTQPEQHDCTVAEMDAAAEGHILISNFQTNPVKQKSLSGYYPMEWVDAFLKHGSFPEVQRNYAQGSCYDTIWAMAIAFNMTIQQLAELGHTKSLDEFEYSDGDIGALVMDAMYNLSFTGIRGAVKFLSTGDGQSTMKIDQVQDGKRLTVGMFYPNDDESRDIVWINGGIKWADVHPPRDSLIIRPLKKYLSNVTFAIACSFAGFGMLLAIWNLIINILCREYRVIKLSSPTINNVILIGCLVLYVAVFLEPLDGTRGVVIFCKLKPFIMATGFSTIFGALFSKTWRVHKIFSLKLNKHLKIKDSQLLGFVGVFLLVQLTVLILWEIIDPKKIVTHNTLQEISAADDDIVIQYQVDMCESMWHNYFIGTIYVMNGALLAFGAFLSWETRKVKVEALNDSQQIGMCIYNTVILSAVGVALSTALTTNKDVLYGSLSACLIIGTTVTQLLIFVPKIMTIFEQWQQVGTIGEESAHIRVTEALPRRVDDLQLTTRSAAGNSCSNA